MKRIRTSGIRRRLRIYSGAVFLLLTLAALAVLFLLFERWRGERNYWKHRRALEAEGEVFDLVDFRPAPVPDEQNFAMTPLFRPLYPANRRRGSSDALKHVESIAPYVKGSGSLSPDRAPAFAGWQAGRRVDLTKWQAYYHTVTNLTLGGPDASPTHDILTALSRFDTELAEVAEASKRPYCWFPLELEAGPSLLTPHIWVVRNMGECYALRASAYLAVGDTSRSAENVLTGLRLACHGSAEPLLITHLFRFAMLNTSVQPLWEGLADGVWNADQLDAFQDQLSQFHFVRDCQLAFRGERSVFQYVTTLGPKELKRCLYGQGTGPPGMLIYCYVYQNAHYGNRFYAEHVLPTIDEQQERIDAAAISAIDQKLDQRPTLRTFLSTILWPAYENTAMRFAHAQTVVWQAELACALERYRLRHGNYPEALEKLVPEFVSELPHDVITGEHLHYRIESSGRYVLYATGWDGTDNGGEPGFKVTRLSNPGQKVPGIRNGDWVWRLDEQQPQHNQR